MSELQVFVIATIFIMVVGGAVPLMIGSFTSTEITLTGLQLITYNFLGGGVDLTGSFDVPTDDAFYDYLAGVQLMRNTFPILFDGIMFIYLFVLVYTIVKALPFT